MVFFIFFANSVKNTNFVENINIKNDMTILKEITDELSIVQKKRLEASLAQSANRQTISNKEMKEKLRITINPNMKKIDPNKSKVIREKIQKANDMLKNIGLPEELLQKKLLSK